MLYLKKFSFWILDLESTFWGSVFVCLFDFTSYILFIYSFLSIFFRLENVDCDSFLKLYLHCANCVTTVLHSCIQQQFRKKFLNINLYIKTCQYCSIELSPGLWDTLVKIISCVIHLRCQNALFSVVVYKEVMLWLCVLQRHLMTEKWI